MELRVHEEGRNGFQFWQYLYLLVNYCNTIILFAKNITEKEIKQKERVRERRERGKCGHTARGKGFLASLIHVNTVPTKYGIFINSRYRKKEREEGVRERRERGEEKERSEERR